MRIPLELIEEFARGNGAIFVGEGLSLQAGLPSLKEVAASLASEIACSAEMPFQEVAYDYELEHERHRLVTRLKEQLDSFHLKPTAVHQALLGLPTSYIFTTNYDDFLERAAREGQRRCNVVIRKEQANFWTADRVQVVKLHGELSQPESLVITLDDYNLYANQHPALIRLLAFALQTRTVLFLGYKGDDANFRQLLTQMRLEAGTFARSGFALLLNASAREIKRLEARQIKVINLELPTPPVQRANFSFFRRKQGQTTTQKPLKEAQELFTTWLKALSQQIEREQKRLAKGSSARQQPLPAEPYKFLDYFEEKDAAIFHGRQDDTNVLLNLVESHPLAVLYGESGTGKTSLLQTAVMPRLREEGYDVAYARPLSNPLDSVQKAILNTFPHATPQTNSLAALVASSLPPNGHLLLILDQFEEFFTRQGPQTRRHFIRELVSLLTLPHCHVHCLLSLRNDYLNQLDEFKGSLGRDPLRYRMRLHNLGPAGARAAIVGPAASFKITIEPLLLDQLLLDLRQNEIAPAQLQVVCYRLWKDWKDTLGEPASGFTLSRYRALGGTTLILANYLDDVIEQVASPKVQRQIGLKLEGQIAQDATRTILKRMITAEQTKVAISGREITEGEAIKKLKIAPQQARQLLIYLRNKRVIRRLPDSKLYELSHEVMIQKVWEWVSDEEKQLLHLQDMLARATADYQRLGILLPLDKLTVLTEEAAHLSPNYDALELLLLSAIEEGTDSRQWISKLESEEAVALLAKQLAKQKRIHYPRIAQALGYTQSRRAIGYLQRLLVDKEKRIQHAAINALVQVRLPQAVNPLYYTAQQENKLPRLMPILEALEKIANNEAVDALFSLASEHTNVHVRARAVDALLHLGHPRTLEFIIELLHHDDTAIHYQAKQTARQLLIKTPDAFDTLLYEPDPQAQLEAIAILEQIGGAQIVMPLMLLLDGQPLVVRAEVIRVLLRSGDKRALQPLLATLAEEEEEEEILDVWQQMADKALVFFLSDWNEAHPQRRVVILKAVAKIWQRPHLAQLESQDVEVRQKAVAAWRALRNKHALPLLLERLQDEELQIQRQAALALGQLADKRAIAPLAMALQAPNATLRQAAARALGELEDQSGLEPLQAALSDQRVEVRKEVATALAKLGREVIYDLLTLVLHDSVADVRHHTAIVLKVLDDERVLDLLQKALQHEDTALRERAAITLVIVGNKAAIETVVEVIQKERVEVRSSVINTFTTIIALFGNEDSQLRWQVVRFFKELQDKQTLEPLIAALEDEDAQVRYQAILALPQLEDERAVEPLIAVLEDEDAQVRYQAILALPQLEDERAVEPLIAALEDKDAQARRAVIKALGKLGDERAVEPLIAALGDDDAQVRQEAVISLRLLGDKRAVESLIAALEDEDAQVRSQTILALQQFGDEQAVGPLIVALEDEDAQIRSQAILALRQLGDKRAVEPLIAALEDEDTQVRFQAILTLRQLGDQRAIEALIVALEDKEAQVRSQAILALWQLGDERVVELSRAALEDEDTQVRSQIILALRQLDSEQAAKPFIAALNNKKSEIRYKVIVTLKKMGDERAIETLIAVLEDEEPQVRTQAILALWQLEDKRAVELFIAALENKNAQVRQEAVISLSLLGDKRAVEPVIALLEDEEAQVRTQAIIALLHFRDERAIEPLIATLEDEEVQVRTQAILALLHFRDKRVVEPLIATLGNEDAQVRKRVIITLIELGDERAVEPLIAYLKDDVQVRQKAVTSLKFLDNKRAFDILRAGLEDENAQVRRKAVGALGKLNDERAVKLLRTILQDEDVEVRVMAVRALGQMAFLALGDLKHKKIWNNLVIALQDNNAEVRAKTVSVLRHFRNELALNLLRNALQDDEADVRARVCRVLGSWRDRRGLKLLLIALQDKSTAVRASAVNALGELGDKEAIEPLLTALGDIDSKVRAKASMALRRFGDKQVVESLLHVLQDQDSQVRANAAFALGELKDRRVVMRLLTALQDEEAEVRAKTAIALGVLGDDRAVKPLIAALEDEKAQVRRRAAKALGQLGNKGAIKPLQTALRDKNSNVRKVAAQALRRLGVEVWA